MTPRAFDSSDGSGGGDAQGDGGGGGAPGADRSSVVHESDYDTDDADDDGPGAAAPTVLSPTTASGPIDDLHVLRLCIHQPAAACAHAH